LTEERRRRWRILAALAVVAVLIILAVVMWPDGNKREPAQLLGTLVAAASLIGSAIVLATWALRRRPPPAVPSDTMIAEAKAALVDQVHRQWKEEARIRALGDPQPIPVAWQLTGKRALMDHPRLITEGELTFSGTADDIRALTARFRGLRSRRLIITGGPGTGKTTLALQPPPPGGVGGSSVGHHLPHAARPRVRRRRHPRHARRARAHPAHPGWLGRTTGAGPRPGHPDAQRFADRE
jgi:hypothetical protein